MRYLLYCALPLAIIVAQAGAQYNEQWQLDIYDPNQAYLIGVANTDNDPNLEMVFLDIQDCTDQNPLLRVADAATGEIEWEYYDFYHVFTERDRAPQLKDLDGDGRREILLMAEYDPYETMWFMFKFMPSGIGSGDYQMTPMPSLSQNRPNPMIHATRIEYSLPAPTQTILRIYDRSGRLVRTLENGVQKAGKHLARWGACDDQGKTVAQGTYYYVLEANGTRAIKQLVLVK